VHAFGEHFFTEPGGGDLQGGGGTQIEPPAGGNAVECVAEQIDTGLQVSYPHP